MLLTILFLRYVYVKKILFFIVCFCVYFFYFLISRYVYVSKHCVRKFMFVCLYVIELVLLVCMSISLYVFIYSVQSLYLYGIFIAYINVFMCLFLICICLSNMKSVCFINISN